MANQFTYQKMDSLDRKLGELNSETNILGDIALFAGKAILGTIKYSTILTGAILYCIGKFAYEKPKHALVIGTLAAAGYFGYNWCKDDKLVNERSKIIKKTSDKDYQLTKEQELKIKKLLEESKQF